MEKFMGGDVKGDGVDETLKNDFAVLEDKIQEGLDVLQEHRKDPKVPLAGLCAAFDLAKRIVSKSRDDPEYWTGDTKLQAQFNDCVLDAWANLTLLQNEQHANKVTKNIIVNLDGLQAGKMSLDEFQAHVKNDREILNQLLQEDKDLHNEKALLGALKNLQDVNDAEMINYAVQDTKVQLNNIKATELKTIALKNLYDAFLLYIKDPDNAVPLLTDHVQNDSKLVVQLAALEDEADPMRSCLIMAQRCVEGNPPPTHPEIELLIDVVLRPQVALHCSAPKSSELNALMATIEEIVEKQSGSVSVKDQVAAQMQAQKGSEDVSNAMDSHRRRLAYRNRMQFTKKADEVVELRHAELCGAEWDGFRVDHVDLHSAVDTRTPVQKAYEAFDMNHDDMITIDEVIDYLLSVKPHQRPKGLENVNPWQKAKVRKKLQKMDTDRDGHLSFEEFSTWWTETQEE
jgi:hypothetical protein